MACVKSIMSWISAKLHLFSQETDLLMKVIMKCVNVKLWDYILGCFHCVLNAPRKLTAMAGTCKLFKQPNQPGLSVSIFERHALHLVSGTFSSI